MENKEVNSKCNSESASSGLLSAYVDVPIKAAKRIAKEFDKDQVIIVCWDRKHNRTHVTTYGKTKIDCIQAVVGGNKVKKAIGWPDHLCHAKPKRR